MNDQKNSINISDSNKRVFKMLKLLRENGKMRSKELVEKLGLKNTRSIRGYKNILELLGYTIETTGGFKNGGYELIEERLTKEELKLINGKIQNFELFLKIKRINDRF